MISQNDMPSEPPSVVKDRSPYSTVSRFTASKSSPSLASHLQDDDLRRTDSLPTPHRESASPTKPSMPWMMPSSTRGAGGFVASAALKRSSTVIKPAPTFEGTDLRARPATMYGRPAGHERNFAGSITSTGSLSPRKLDFTEPKQEEEDEKPLQRSFQRSAETRYEPSPPNQEETLEGPIPKPPPHKTPPLLQDMFAKSPLEMTPPKEISVEIPPVEPSPIERPSTPPRLPTSASTDSLARKRWSPTKSSWLDSALQKANDPPSSPPKRMSSIRPIAPAVPTNKWSSENKPTITKSTSFTSALGGMGGRRDVAGITPSTKKVESSIEARLAALERRVVTPPKQELPRSQSLRDTLKPVSPTPSPPTTKPKWSPSGIATSKAAVDPVKERLLAARSGLARTPVKPPTFSDPLKEGILAAREKLKIQDKQKEKKEDELKASILNARKGLRRHGSKEESEKSVSGEKIENTPPPREREKTPVIEEEVVVKQEEITPQKPKFEKAEVSHVVEKPFQAEIQKPVQVDVQKPVQIEATKPPITSQSIAVTTQRKQPEPVVKSLPLQSIQRTPSESKASPLFSESKQTNTVASKPSPSKTTVSSVLQNKATPGIATAPKSAVQPSQPTKDVEIPTPQKRSESAAVAPQIKKETETEAPPKPVEEVKRVKQTSLPTVAKSAPVKGTVSIAPSDNSLTSQSF